MTKILIVDDNQQNLYMLQVLLSAKGYEVEQASNGAEALEQARRNPPELVVSDILMPVMDGFALCRAWKKDEQLNKVPFVFYTATYTDPKDEDFALSLGAERFVVKPMEPDEFMIVLQETIEASEASKLTAVRETLGEAEFLKEYNAALVRKLEDKVLQLEEKNRALELDITERKKAEAKIRQQLTELQNWYDLTIDRETRALELKHEINELLRRLGEKPRYSGA
jgi:CheY-like chemotaxis protein